MRALALAAAFMLPAGCDDEDDDGSGPPPANDTDLVFVETFAGEFPGPRWTVTHGVPFIEEERLVVGVLQPARLQGAFAFHTSPPLTLRFDFALPQERSESDARFRFILRGEDGFERASFDVRLQDAVIDFRILNQHGEFDSFPDTQFRTIAFTVDQGLASWSVDGDPFLTLGGFPEGLYRIEIESVPGLTRGFQVDTIVIERGREETRNELPTVRDSGGDGLPVRLP